MNERPRSGAAGPADEARALLAPAREVLQQLAVLIRNSYLHGLGNEVFVEPLEKAESALRSSFGSEGHLRLERTGEEFYANGVRIRMELQTLQAYKYLLEELSRRDVGGFSFVPPVTRDALRALLEVLASVRSSEDGVATVNGQLAERGITGIQALPMRVDEEPEGERLDARERAIQAYQQALDFIRESLSSYDSPAQVNVRRAKRSVQKLVDVSFEQGESFSLAAWPRSRGTTTTPSTTW